MNCKALAVLRGDVPIMSAGMSTPQTRGLTNSDPASISVTASGGQAPLCVLGFYCCSEGDVNPRTFTPAKDAEIFGTAFSRNMVYIAWRFDAAVGQNTTIDMVNNGGQNGLIGCYLELTT